VSREFGVKLILGRLGLLSAKCSPATGSPIPTIVRPFSYSSHVSPTVKCWYCTFVRVWHVILNIVISFYFFMYFIIMDVNVFFSADNTWSLWHGENHWIDSKWFTSQRYTTEQVSRCFVISRICYIITPLFHELCVWYCLCKVSIADPVISMYTMSQSLHEVMEMLRNIELYYWGYFVEE